MSCIGKLSGGGHIRLIPYRSKVSPTLINRSCILSRTRMEQSASFSTATVQVVSMQVVSAQVASSSSLIVNFSSGQIHMHSPLAKLTPLMIIICLVIYKRHEMDNIRYKILYVYNMLFFVCNLNLDWGIQPKVSVLCVYALSVVIATLKACPHLQVDSMCLQCALILQTTLNCFECVRTRNGKRRTVGV